VETIITQFIHYVQGNEQTCRDAGRHTQDVYPGKKPTLSNVADGKGEIVSEHDQFLLGAVMDEKLLKTTILMFPAWSAIRKKV